MRFYFTAHPSDLGAARIPPGCHVMTVASAHWCHKRQAFEIHRPPATTTTMAIDSGGFTAAQRWGRYPWSPEQYIDFIRTESRRHILDFCASMDYACEPDVNRHTYATNIQRINATISNEQQLRRLAPELPWLPVLQGYTIPERTHDLHRRQELGLISPYMGIGSICGTNPTTARTIIKFYARLLPDTTFHAFGLAARTLDDPTTAAAIRSWDSYAWAWGRGMTDVDRPDELNRRPDESWSELTYRMALWYQHNVVNPRLHQPTQPPLPYAEGAP